MINNNDCAFPADARNDTEGGLTKREYFAAINMSAFIARGEGISISPDLFAKEAQLSVLAADALINVLNQQL